MLNKLPGLDLQAACLLAAVFVLSACSTPDAQRTAPASQLQAAWVVLGEQGQAVARAITLDEVCPILRQDGQAQRMAVRAAPARIAQRKTVSRPEDSKASDFPVLTCDAILNADVQVASIEGRALALPKALPQKIIVLGDTGCRLQKGSNYFQECNNAAKWAFAAVAKTAAGFQPDLVIHVGDYHYRENACTDGKLDCAGSPWGYGWDTWQADFFTPAAPLLTAAPWVLVRGNHESCARAGQGWWRLLDPRPLLAGRDCNLETDDIKGDYSAPYAVPLGVVDGESAQLIIFDSAKVPNRALAQTEAAYPIYLQQLQKAGQLAAQAEQNFFIEHHPILAFAPERSKDGKLKMYPGNAALQDLLQSLHGTRLFPAKVQATLAGHVHLFEALTFETDHPAQFVSGNGGSSLDVALPTPLAPGSTPFAPARLAHFSNSNQTGFMSMQRVEHGWKILAHDQRGKPYTSCLLQAKVSICNTLD